MMDDLLREKINNLDTVPPGLIRDKEAGWGKIKKNQKAIARKADFVKKAAWGIIFASVVTGAFLFYGFERSEEVRKTEREIHVSPAKKEPERQLQKQPAPVYIKPNPVQRITAQEKTVASKSIPKDTSTNVIVPQTPIKPFADNEKKLDTIKTPKVLERHPTQ